jgi:hypothetical protein
MLEDIGHSGRLMYDFLWMVLNRLRMRRIRELRVYRGPDYMLCLCVVFLVTLSVITGFFLIPCYGTGPMFLASNTSSIHSCMAKSSPRPCLAPITVA